MSTDTEQLPPLISEVWCVLGCGEILEFREEKVIQGDGSEKLFNQLVCKKSGIVLLKMPDNAFPQTYKPQIIELFSKLFATLEPKAVVAEVVPFSRMDNINSFVSFVENGQEKYNFTPMESMFSAFLNLRQNMNESRKENIVSIIKKHVEMFEAETFDTMHKVLSAINPIRGRLGFANYTITDRVDFSEEQIRLFQDNPALLAIFRKYAYAVGHNDSSRVDPSLREIPLRDLSSDVNPVKRNQYANDNLPSIATDFLDFPRGFEEYLNGLKIREVNIITRMLPNNISLELAVGISDYLLTSLEFGRSPEGLLAANSVYNDVFKKVVHTVPRKKELFLMNEWFLNVAAVAPGTLSIIREWADNPDNNGWEDFEKIREILSIQQDTKWKAEMNRKWIKGASGGDFLVNELYKILGAEKTLSAIELVSKSDVSLTVSQWLEFAESPNDYLDNPVSWWSSLMPVKCSADVVKIGDVL